MAGVNVRPLGDRVLVQPLEEQEVKKGGIIIPDTAKEKPQEGKVVALGTGKIDDNGKKVEFTVKKGDKVLISKYGGTDHARGRHPWHHWIKNHEDEEGIAKESRKAGTDFEFRNSGPKLFPGFLSSSEISQQSTISIK
jgi:chaperonin GroES